MSVFLKKLALLAAAMAATLAASLTVAAAQSRTALVVGQGGYRGAEIRTAVNDAGLVAQALTGAGFEVIQGRDLGASDLRRIVRDFLDKVEAGGPDGEVMIYLSGHGVQLEGENYLLPVDARIARDSDIPIEGLRLSDLMRSLAAAPGRVRIVVADLAHDYPLPAGAQGIAPGLALVDPLPGFLVAFSSAPNIPVPESKEPYGAYAPALVEMIREPGLPLDEVFARARLRTHQVTDGQQVPWHVSDVKGDFIFLEVDPAVAVSAAPAPAPRQPRRISELAPDEGYSMAVERDTIQDYQEFLRRNPNHRESRRVAALLAARREAVVWRKTVSRDTPNAYWTYLRQYPRGPHAPDARRRLARLQAQLAPPVVFEEIIYEDLPPPLPVVEVIEVVEVVTIIRRLPPPPPPPIFILPPRDEIIVVIISRPPPPPPLIGILPIPVAIPFPVHARAPRWYQPIAPITPRGPVLIPVAAPERLSREEFRERRERNRDRPFAPFLPRESTVPNQPGLSAPIVPIATRPPEDERVRGDGNRDRRNGNRDGNRDRREQDRGARLPLQPIPLGERPENVQLPGAAQPGLPGAAVGRQDGQNPRDARQEGQSPRDARRDGQDRDRRDGRGEQPAATLPGLLPEPGRRADEREQRQRDRDQRRESGTPPVDGAPSPLERLGRDGQQREDRRAVDEPGRERRQGSEGQQGRTVEDQLRRAAEEQQRQQRRAREEQEGARGRALELQQRRAGEEQERERRQGQQQEQQRAGDQQEREQRRAAEQEQRRAAEQEQREQRRAGEQQQRRAAEEQERQQRRAAEQEQRRAAEQQQRRAAEEQQREQRRAAEQEQRRAIEQQQRRAVEQEQRRAIEQQQRRAVEQEQRRAIEQQQRRAAEEQQREQRRAVEQQQRRAMEEQERQQRRAIEQQQQRAMEQQRRSEGAGDGGRRGDGDGGGRRGDGGGGGGGRKSLECQLTGRC